MKLLFTSLISLLGLLVVSCDTAKKPAEKITEANLSGTYRIVEILGKDYAEEGLIMEIETTTNTFNVKTPCNGVFGKFILDDSAIQFESVAATKMYCEGKMQPEKDLTAALTETVSLGKERAALVFYSGENEKAVLRAVDIIERNGN